MDKIMVYTVGRKDIYERAMREHPGLEKAKGGSVWRSRALAEGYLEATGQKAFRAYGVRASWKDATPVPGASWRALKKEAVLVRLKPRKWVNDGVPE